MAPYDDPYFPELEKCLSGSALLISWKLAFETLCDRESAEGSSWLLNFLSCNSSIRLLASPARGFPGASADSSSDLETRTAAINVTPASHGSYNIEEIKQDALWLSKEVNLEEVEALRIATLEWQNRPTYRLKQGFSENERLSVRQLAGALNASGPLPRILGESANEESSKSFLAVERRRPRLLAFFLEERRSLLGTCRKLSSLAVATNPIHQTSNQGGKDIGLFSGASKLTKIGDDIFQSVAKNGSKQSSDTQVLSCIEAMQSRLSSLEGEREKYQWMTSSVDMDMEWVNTNLHELIILCDIVHLNWRKFRRIAKSSVVLPWFQMMAKYDFFTNFSARSALQTELVAFLQVSAATTSVALLDPARAISYLLESEVRLQIEQPNDEGFVYFLDLSHISEFQRVFASLAGSCISVASPAIFAWGIIVYTIRELGLLAKEARDSQHVQRAIDQDAATNEPQRGRRMSSSSVGSTQQSIYEDVIDRARDVPPDDPVEFLTHSALTVCQVFDVMANIASSPPPSGCATLEFWRNIAFLDLVKVSFDSIGYTPELLTATFSILDAEERNDLTDVTIRSTVRRDLAHAFMSDDFLMSKVFDTALSRFPYEALPLLRLCKMLADVEASPNANVPSIADRLLVIKSFTHSIPPHFTGYHTIREDENANLVSLEQPLDMCATSESVLLPNTAQGIEVDDSYLIPNGVTGQVVSESKPLVIIWYHRYSGLGLLGRWLQLFHNGQEANFMRDSPGSVALATIQLLTALLKSSDEDDGRMILEQSSDGLERNSDIILVVFEIFEQQILGLRFKKAAEGALSTAAACLEFMEIVIGFFPGRVWSSIARSSLLSLTGSGSLLATIMSTEATIGTSNFIMASTQLYARLLENAVERTLSIDSHRSKTRELKRVLIASGSGAPTHVVAQSLLGLTQAMVEVYDSLSNWQIKPVIQQVFIKTRITQTFRSLLDYGFGIGIDNSLRSKLGVVMSTVSPYVLDFFRPDSQKDTNLCTVLQVLSDGLEEQGSLHQEGIFQSKVLQTEQTLWFCYGLLQAARVKENSELLERQLYQTIPILLRLYGMHGRYQLPCIKIMTELTAVRSVSESDGTSLLSLLGADSSRNLLEILSAFDKPRSNTELFIAVWRLLTNLLSAGQQWFAIYLLTGSSPQEKLKDGISSSPSTTVALRGKPFLQTALDSLLHIEVVEGRRAIEMLRFVCRAQENWSWATTSGQSHPDFFASIAAYVGRLDFKQYSTLGQSFQYRIAALIAELATVYLHLARSNRDISIIKQMLPAFRWYAANAVETPEYNTSLHANLRRNLQSRYPNCDILSFKKTMFFVPTYGEDFFYDIAVASKMLSFDPSWSGTARNPGFAHEFKLANLNLSLVDSQLSLLHSFKSSCLEHSAFFARDRQVQKLMAQIVRNSLGANSRPCPSEKIFDSLFETRMELAVGLLQRLVEFKARGSEFATLLANAWETTKFRNENFNAAIANDDLHYYRFCLASLLLSSQLHVETRHSSQQATSPGRASHISTRSIIVEILSDIVAEGVGQVSGALLDQTQSHRQVNMTKEEDGSASQVGLRDLSLMLAILHSCLQLPIVSQMTAQLSSVFNASNIIDATIRLYSWSHRLSPPDVDPAYSSCALSFLVVLSTLPPVAEELGVESVLSRLSTSRITLALQSVPGGVSPFDISQQQRQNIRRLLHQFPHQRRLYAVWSEGIIPLCLNLLHSVGRPMAGEIASFLNQFPDQLARASVAFASSSSASYNHSNNNSKPPADTDGAICLSLAGEATRLALISHILSTYRLAGASAGVDSFDIPVLTNYDEPENKKGLTEDIEELLGAGSVSLWRNRIVATNEREVGWARVLRDKKNKKKTGIGDWEDEAENLLESRILDELKSALLCLKGSNGGEEG